MASHVVSVEGDEEESPNATVPDGELAWSAMFPFWCTDVEVFQAVKEISRRNEALGITAALLACAATQSASLKLRLIDLLAGSRWLGHADVRESLFHQMRAEPDLAAAAAMLLLLPMSMPECVATGKYRGCLGTEGEDLLVRRAQEVHTRLLTQRNSAKAVPDT